MRCLTRVIVRFLGSVANFNADSATTMATVSALPIDAMANSKSAVTDLAITEGTDSTDGTDATYSTDGTANGTDGTDSLANGTDGTDSMANGTDGNVSVTGYGMDDKDDANANEVQEASLPSPDLTPATAPEPAFVEER